MRIVITGGAGFIGSHLVEGLARVKADVKVIDNLSSGKIENIRPSSKKIKFVKGDIRDLALLKKEFKDYGVVLHQAAIIEVVKSVRNPLNTNDVNVNGTLKVLLAAKDAGIKRVVFASSAAVYGDKENVRENSELSSRSPYATTKIAGEEYCRLFYHLYGLETVILRYFNIYGKGQPSNTSYGAVIPNFISALQKGKKPTIFGDGKQTRDYVYVKDIVAANLLALKKKSAVGKTFNVASGESVSILDLFSTVSKILKKRVRPKFSKEREGDIKYSSANIENSINYLGYLPKYNIEKGIRDMLK